MKHHLDIPIDDEQFALDMGSDIEPMINGSILNVEIEMEAAMGFGGEENSEEKDEDQNAVNIMEEELGISDIDESEEENDDQSSSEGESHETMSVGISDGQKRRTMDNSSDDVPTISLEEGNIKI